MVHPNCAFLRSVGMTIGAVIGVGVFGLPFAFARSGVGLGILELLVLGCLITVLLLMLGEMVVQTPGHHRLVSYVEMYVGGPWKWVTLIALGLGIWGAMLAYMLVGGTFLHLLLSPVLGGPVELYSYLVAIIPSVVIFGGLKFAAKFEYIIVGTLLFLFIFIIFASFPKINLSNFTTLNFSEFFVPYGVLLFSFGGLGIVPEIKDVLSKKHRHEMAAVLITASVIIAVLYALFSMAVVGVTGVGTSEMAFDGLVPHLGDVFTILGTFLGSLTILSIYIVLGIELLDTFKFDFNIGHRSAWLLVCVVPIILYVLGIREFIGVIGFVGSVFGGGMGILIALAYWSMRRRGLCKRHHCINFPAPLTWLIITIFSIGTIWEIYFVLIH